MEHLNHPFYTSIQGSPDLITWSLRISNRSCRTYKNNGLAWQEVVLFCLASLYRNSHHSSPNIQVNIFSTQASPTCPTTTAPISSKTKTNVCGAPSLLLARSNELHGPRLSIHPRLLDLPQLLLVHRLHRVPQPIHVQCLHRLLRVI